MEPLPEMMCYLSGGGGKEGQGKKVQGKKSYRNVAEDRVCKIRKRVTFLNLQIVQTEKTTTAFNEANKKISDQPPH